MNTPENIKGILKLKPIGTDSWSRPVYEDQNWHLWKDITLGSNNPKLCSVLNDAFDGEPDIPIRRPFTILSKKEQVDEDKRFQYQMLDRYRCDCDYYLGYGNRNCDVLPSKDERKHIETRMVNMGADSWIWKSNMYQRIEPGPFHPEWLAFILAYENLRKGKTKWRNY